MSSLSIKGTIEGLIIHIEGTPLFENIKSELTNKLESHKGFFKSAVFCLEGGNNLDQEQKQSLIELCVDNGMIHNDTILTTTIGKDRQNPQRNSNNADDFDNMVINRNIRSGQKVIAKKDLVVVGNVNPGAELVAGGNIVIMGSLKGMAHAGAEGNLFATITAQEMLPSQIRIADIVAYNPDKNKPAPMSQTEIAYVKDNKIVVERFKNNSKTLRGVSIA